MKVRMKRIETISYYTDKGELLPLRFRIENRDGTRQVVHIDKVLYTKKDKKAGNSILIYDCQTRINGLLRPLQLMYDIASYSWFLYKI